MDQYGELSDQITLLHARLLKQYPALKAAASGSAPFFPLLSKLAEEEGEDSLPYIYRNLLYKRAILTRDASLRTNCVCEIIRHLDKHTPIILFCERISQADEVCMRLEYLFPGQTVRYHSQMSRDVRKRALNAFSDHEARILVTCKALDEGLDVPDATIGIVMSCTSTQRQRIQRLGRILRKGHDKPAAILYYLYVRESMEDNAYLPELSSIASVHAHSLSFDPHDNSFLCADYNQRAVKVLRRARERHLDEGQMLELRQCLEYGIIRPDWLLPLSWCEKQKNNAASIHERNYWIVMKQMCQMEDT